MPTALRRVSAWTLAAAVALLPVLPFAPMPSQADAPTDTALLSAPRPNLDHSALARPVSPSLRSRLATLRPERLPTQARGQRLELNLFRDANLTGVVDYTYLLGEHSRAWGGHLAEGGGGYWMAVRTAGVYLIHVGGPDGIYEVSRAAGSTYQVSQVRQRRAPETLTRLPGKATGNPEAASAPRLASANEPARPTKRRDDGSVIDVAIAYTPQAAAESAGDVNVQAKITLAVAQTNQAYQQSGVATRLNLVGIAPVGDEIGNADADLGALTNPADGRYDEIAGWRDAVRADMVQLWIDGDESSCGTAPLYPDAAQAFAVVDQSCATSNYSAAHEFGHIQGLSEDVFVNQPSAFAYGHGYVSINGGNSFRTVMAQYDQCGAAGIPPVYCPRMLYFSNPAVSIGGTATGTDTANNARVLNETAARVASFRGGPTITGSPAVGGTLTVVPGTVAPGTVIDSYQWYLNGAPVSGANQPSVTVPVDWLGGTVSAGYVVHPPAEAARAEATGGLIITKGTFVAKKPFLRGKKTKRGKVLKIKMKQWTPKPTYQFRWFRGKKRIKGANERRYRLVARDQGRKISVKVVGKLPGYAKAVTISKRKRIT